MFDFQRDLSLVKDENGAEESLEKRSENLAGTSGSDMVTCPVCGNKVRGEEYMINSHLGVSSFLPSIFGYACSFVNSILYDRI